MPGSVGINPNLDVKTIQKPGGNTNTQSTDNNSGNTGSMNPWTSSSGYSSDFNFGSAFNQVNNTNTGKTTTHTATNTGVTRSGNTSSSSSSNSTSSSSSSSSSNNTSGSSTGNSDIDDIMNITSTIATSVIDILKGTIGDKEKTDAQSVGKEQGQAAKQTNQQLTGADNQIKDINNQANGTLQNGISNIETMGDDNAAQVDTINETREQVADINAQQLQKQQTAEGLADRCHELGDRSAKAVSVSQNTTTVPTGGDGGGGNVTSPTAKKPAAAAGGGGTTPSVKTSNGDLGELEAKKAELEQTNEEITELGGQKTELAGAIADSMSQVLSNIAQIQSEQSTMQEIVQFAADTTQQIAKTIQASTTQNTTKMSAAGAQEGVKGTVNTTTSGIALAGEQTFGRLADAAESNTFTSSAATELRQKEKTCASEKEKTGQSNGAAHINFQNMQQITTQVLSIVDALATGNQDWSSMSAQIGDLMSNVGPMVQDAIDKGKVDEDDSGGKGGAKTPKEPAPEQPQVT